MGHQSLRQIDTTIPEILLQRDKKDSWKLNDNKLQREIRHQAHEKQYLLVRLTRNSMPTGRNLKLRFTPWKSKIAPAGDLEQFVEDKLLQPSKEVEPCLRQKL